MTKPNRLVTLARSTAALVLLIATQPMAYAASSSSTVTCPTTATVIAPIVITKDANLDFGNIVPGGSAGTVVMAPAGTRSSTGGTTLGTAGTASPGTFTITGLTGAAYTIGTSAVVALTNGTPAQDMALGTFTNDTTGVIGGGSVTLHVGATLTVAATGSQPAGAYTGSFDITVTYN